MREFPEKMRTGRTLIRDITIDDAEGWKRFNNRINKKMPSWPKVPGIVYARNEVIHHLINRDAGTEYVYSICSHEGKIIGDMHITNIDRKKKKAEIGHALDPSCWGKGLSHEVLAAICAVATKRGYSLWVKVEEDNIRSWRSLENFGAAYRGRERFFFDGKPVELRVYDLPKRPASAFDRKVYAALLKVPKGRVTTYSSLAKKIGVKSPRSIGQALRRNPFAPRVPCHRVVANNGRIGGFMGETGGNAIKKKISLLKTEGVIVKKGKVVDFDEKKI